MRIFLALLSGFVLALTTFAAGAITMVFFFNAEPASDRLANADPAEVWTDGPVPVDTSAQELERLPARPAPQSSDGDIQAQAGDDIAPGLEADADQAIDFTTTASIPSQEPDEAVPPQPVVPRLNAAHVQWCSDQYRSYRPDDNSYTPYSGGSRECVSPFSDDIAEGASPPSEESGSLAGASSDAAFAADTSAGWSEASGGEFSQDHVQSCFERYRSYRPEDNTYQPYSGGPRQQCQ